MRLAEIPVLVVVRARAFLLDKGDPVRDFPLLLALCAFGDATLTHQPVARYVQLIELGLHPRQQLFRGLGRNACPLKVPNFSPLPVDLAAPTFNFFPDVCDLN